MANRAVVAPRTPRAQPGRLRSSVALGVGAAAVLTGLVLYQVRGRPFAGLVQPGASGPAAALITRDFPGLRLPPTVGNDGQLFYAIARDPLHPTQTAHLLDRPRYRLQRPFYPLLAWALHPWGGGNGLVAALLAINALAAALTVATLAWWARRHGRSLLWGLGALALPGAFLAARISCADLLATGLALLASVLLLEDHPKGATIVGLAAVLTKESMLVLLAGEAVVALASGRRRRTVVAFAGVPAGVAAVLWVALLITFPHAGHQYAELGTPLRGLSQSAAYWRASGDWKPAVTVAATLALALVALRQGGRSSFGISAAGYLALAAFQTMATLAFWTSAPRTLYPLGLCSIAALLDGRPTSLRPRTPAASPTACPARAPVASGSAAGANAASGSAQQALQ
jgi:hypothetical protein